MEEPMLLSRHICCPFCTKEAQNPAESKWLRVGCRFQRPWRTRVCPSVIFQVPSGGELLAAVPLLADEWLLSVVRAHVNLQPLQHVEALPAAFCAAPEHPVVPWRRESQTKTIWCVLAWCLELDIHRCQSSGKVSPNLLFRWGNTSLITRSRKVCWTRLPCVWLGTCAFWGDTWDEPARWMSCSSLQTSSAGSAWRAGDWSEAPGLHLQSGYVCGHLGNQRRKVSRVVQKTITQVPESHPPESAPCTG